MKGWGWKTGLREHAATRQTAIDLFALVFHTEASSGGAVPKFRIEGVQRDSSICDAERVSATFNGWKGTAAAWHGRTCLGSRKQPTEIRNQQTSYIPQHLDITNDMCSFHSFSGSRKSTAFVSLVRAQKIESSSAT
jgi:hypothetical protein